MKKQMVILAGALLFASTAAMANPPGHHDRGSHASRQRSHGRHDSHAQGYYVRHDRGRHEGWYRKGGHLPGEYRGSHYVVTDWHRRHLRQPPRGYHWVRSDGNRYLLVAIATGVIADIFLSH